MTDNIQNVEIQPNTWIDLYDVTGIVVGNQIVVENSMRSRDCETILFCEWFAFAVFGYVATTYIRSTIYFIAGSNLNLAYILQVLVYACVFFGNVLTFYFAREIFFPKMQLKWIHLYGILGIIIISIIALGDSSYTKIFPDSTDYPSVALRPVYSLIVIIYLFPVILGIMIKY